MFTCRRCSVWNETRFTKACDAVRHLLECHPVKMEKFLCDQLPVEDVERLLLDDDREKGGIKKHLHLCMSLDIDRYNDAELAKTYCPISTMENGEHPTPAQLREAIASMRAKGLEVFPPCDNTNERGYCKGHAS